MHPQPEELRAEVRAWLNGNWRPGIRRKAWLAQVVDAGYAVPTWPTEWYGRDYPPDLAAVITEGGPAKGLSADMPASKLSKTEVRALVAYLRKFAGGSR